MPHKNHKYSLKPWIGGLALFFALSATSFAAKTIQLTWNASIDPAVTGYNLSYGTASGNYPQTVNTGRSHSASVSLNSGTTYYFVVTAYDSMGLQSAPSNEVSLTVGANSPPTVSLTSPTSGASLDGLHPIGLTASASDSDGSIAKVEFYQDSNKIGEATSSPYAATWNNAPVGNCVLTALAYDDSGAAVRSAGVPVRVNGAAPTPSPSPSPTPPGNNGKKKIRIFAQISEIRAGSPAKFRISVAQTDVVAGSPTVVNYSLGGSAQGGVDYSTSGLTGQVTIPAGSRTTTLTLNTLDTAGTGGRKMAIATLLPTADTYPAAVANKAAIAILNR